MMDAIELFMPVPFQRCGEWFEYWLAPPRFDPSETRDGSGPNETKLSGERKRVRCSAPLGCDDLVQAFEDGHEFFGGKVGDSLA